jgi:hypothetical protein
MRLELLEDWRTVGQLALLCQCGKAVELKRFGCCRSCYDRRQHSLRFFGGLRERVVRRDGFRCRACGANSRLLVHHRATDNEEHTLITLCIRCHVRVHRWRWFRHKVSSTLVQLWSELHAGAPLQLQLPLGTATETRRQEENPKDGQYRLVESPQPNLVLGEKPSERLFACVESHVGQIRLLC